MYIFVFIADSAPRWVRQTPPMQAEANLICHAVVTFKTAGGIIVLDECRRTS